MPSRAWLPDEALRGGVVERVIADAVLRWSEKWFARQLVGGLEPAVRLDCAAAGGEEAPHTYVNAAGLAVVAGAKARTTIAGMMLDTVIDASTLTPADRSAVEALADGCAEDLGRELGRAFHVSGDTAWRRTAGHALPFVDAETFGAGCVDGKPLLQVSIEYGLAVELIKSRAPVAAAGVTLRPVAEGLARQPVPVSALVGRCQISLGDLAGLAAGDVLVLDRDVDGDLELALGGRVTPARCSVDHDERGLRLKLLNALDG